MSCSSGSDTQARHGVPTLQGPMELSPYPRKSVDVNMVEQTSYERMEANKEIDESTQSRPTDVVDMKRMGKSQQLIRRFREITIAAFIGVTVCAWEYALFLISPALVDGGQPALIYNVIWSMLGFLTIYLSLAEMASMAPIAGSLYHWVSEFAPDSVQGIMSYFTGWTSTLAWQGGNAQGQLLAGTLIQTMILVMDENYAFPAYQGTLLTFVAIAVAYVINVYGVRGLPYWQVPVFALAIMTYFAYIIPIWVNAPKASSAQVWSTGWSDTGGWNNLGLAVLVGQLSGIGMWTGVDTAAHMAEEVKDASIAVPRAMMTVFGINCIMVIPLIITVCYAMPDVSAALNDPTDYPTIYVMRQAMSDVWIVVILAILTILVEASNITYLAAVSRDLFAFARDRGVPFSAWLSRVDPKRSIPANANIFSCLVAGALALIYIGSSTAFYAITALSTVSVLQCYIFSIGSVLWRRITKPQTLPPARFSLGRYGVLINSIAVCFSIWSFFWCFWPQAQPVTASGFNWAGPIYVLALLVAALYYVFRARHTYDGPVTSVEGRGRGI